MPSLGSAGEGFRWSEKGPPDIEEDGRGALIVDMEGEVDVADTGGARGGEVVRGRGSWAFWFGLEKRCGAPGIGV